MASLDQIRWIGGGSGAGKTSVARTLADRFGLTVYSTDVTIGQHTPKLDASAAPLLAAFRSRWVSRDPAEMYRSFPWFKGEGFELLLDDLRSLSATGPVLVEGFRLLPALVGPLLADSRDATWLIPTNTFRREAFAVRTGTDAFWLPTGDPERAMANLLARDALFSGQIVRDVEARGLPLVVVDGTRSLNATADMLAKQFRLVDD